LLKISVLQAVVAVDNLISTRRQPEGQIFLTRDEPCRRCVFINMKALRGNDFKWDDGD